MCCFSKPVTHVSSTRLFARGLPDGGQFLAYAMRFGAAEDLAMVLPLPVPPGCGEDAVRFVDLSGVPDLFARLDAAFPAPQALSVSRGPAARASTLAVKRVGAFEASFAPTVADLDRLDARFRIDASVWRKLGDCEGRGFVVFKLHATASLWERLTADAGRDVHPMGFTFPRRDASTLFFPTVHVHDGEAHPRAAFDHTLYAQVQGRPGAFPEGFPLRWQVSEQRLGEVVSAPALAPWVESGDVLFRAQVVGEKANRDVVVPDVTRISSSVVERALSVLFGDDEGRARALLEPVSGWAGEDPAEVRLSALWHGEQAGGGLAALQGVLKRPWLELREEAVQPSLTAARRARGRLDDDETTRLGRADEVGWERFVRRFVA